MHALCLPPGLQDEPVACTISSPSLEHCSLPVGLLPPVAPSCSASSTPPGGSQHQGLFYHSTPNSGTISRCGKSSLTIGMGSAFSFPLLPKPPLISTFLLTPRVVLGMGPSTTTSGFRANGSPPISSTPILGLALPGKSSTQFTLLACYGLHYGQIRGYVSFATTRQQLQSCRPRTPKSPEL